MSTIIPENPHDVWNGVPPPGEPLGGVRDLDAASHLPLFLSCIAATTGPVLEIGVGFHSTPLIHALLRHLGRPFVSAESNLYWLEVFKRDYTYAGDGQPGDAASGFSHRFVVDDLATLSELANTRWGVVLVDDSPGWPRCENVRIFLPVADYIVVHDAQGPDIMEPMAEVVAAAPYKTLHKRYFPWTFAVSNTRPIPAVV